MKTVDIINDVLKNSIHPSVRNGMSKQILINRLTMIAASRVCAEKFYYTDTIECDERSIHHGVPIGTVRKIPKSLYVIEPQVAAAIIKECKTHIKKYI